MLATLTKEWKIREAQVPSKKFFLKKLVFCFSDKFPCIISLPP